MVNRILRQQIEGKLINPNEQLSKKDLIKNMTNEQLINHIKLCQGYVEAGWDIIFSEMNGVEDMLRKTIGFSKQSYKPSTLVVFDKKVSTAC
jgi:predicted metalloprotease